MTIAAVFLKYIPFVLSFKAYSLKYGFISSFFSDFYTTFRAIKDWNHVTLESRRFEDLVKSLDHEQHPLWSGQSIAMMIITINTLSYTIIVGNIKAYFPKHASTLPDFTWFMLLCPLQIDLDTLSRFWKVNKRIWR